MVSYWDEAVGNITAAYKEKGMWENTLMVLTTEYAKPFPQKVFCKSTRCNKRWLGCAATAGRLTGLTERGQRGRRSCLEMPGRATPTAALQTTGPLKILLLCKSCFPVVSKRAGRAGPSKALKRLTGRGGRVERRSCRAASYPRRSAGRSSRTTSTSPTGFRRFASCELLQPSAFVSLHVTCRDPF